jgi:archaellum biogenesis protein FlaJ (TadC family)
VTKSLKERLVEARMRRKSKSAKQEAELVPNKQKSELEGPLSFAYGFIGDKTARFLPLFKGLDQSLLRSGLRTNFKAYVSLTVLATCVVTLSMGIVTSLLLIVLRVPFGSALMFGVGVALFTSAMSVIGFYLYPIYRADKHKRELDDELPFTTGYMSILASAGVSPEKMFNSLATLSVPLAASSEARDVVTNVNLFGMDIISALEKTSSRIPSQKVQDMIQGMISTIHTGGNLGGFLRERFKSHMKLKRISLKKFADSLSVLSEIYVALLLTGPLLFVIMLSVMSVLGGGGLMGLSPDLLLSLLTYIGIPVCALIFLVIMDSSSPKW